VFGAAAQGIEKGRRGNEKGRTYLSIQVACRVQEERKETQEYFPI